MGMTRAQAVRTMKKATMLVASAQMLERRFALSAMRALNMTTEIYVKGGKEPEDRPFSKEAALIALECVSSIVRQLKHDEALADELDEIAGRVQLKLSWDEELPIAAKRDVVSNVAQIVLAGIAERQQKAASAQGR